MICLVLIHIFLDDLLGTDPYFCNDLLGIMYNGDILHFLLQGNGSLDPSSHNPDF